MGDGFLNEIGNAWHGWRTDEPTSGVGKTVGGLLGKIIGQIFGPIGGMAGGAIGKSVGGDVEAMFTSGEPLKNLGRMLITHPLADSKVMAEIWPQQILKQLPGLGQPQQQQQMPKISGPVSPIDSSQAIGSFTEPVTAMDSSQGFLNSDLIRAILENTGYGGF